MGTEWREVTVDEIKSPTSNSLATGPFGSAIGSNFFRDVGVPVIRGSNLSDQIEIRLRDEEIVFLDPEKAREFSRSIVRKGDLVFTCWGTVGQVGLVDERARYDEYVVSNKQMKLTPDPQQADSLFLYYLFSGPRLLQSIQNNAIGSSVPGFNLTQLRGLRLHIPSLAIQRGIARLLGAIDDKIDLNQRVNETLEAMAHALFKSWFVDFDPIRAKAKRVIPTGMSEGMMSIFPDTFSEASSARIPRGWCEGSVLDFAELISGGTPKTSVSDYWNGRVPWVTAADVSRAPHAFLLKSERMITPAALDGSSTKMVASLATVVVARGATTGRMVLLGKDMAMNQTCYALRARNGADFFLYSLLSHAIHRFTHAAHGSVFDTITTQTFQVTPVLLPNDGVMRAYDGAARSWFLLMRERAQESELLAATRDTLLPKLLSGELRIKDAEKLASTVL